MPVFEPCRNNSYCKSEKSGRIAKAALGGLAAYLVVQGIANLPEHSKLHNTQDTVSKVSTEKVNRLTVETPFTENQQPSQASQPSQPSQPDSCKELLEFSQSISQSMYTDVQEYESVLQYLKQAISNAGVAIQTQNITRLKEISQQIDVLQKNRIGSLISIVQKETDLNQKNAQCNKDMLSNK